MTWYNSYTGFPYKHLGDDTKTGIDCFNLCRLVYKEKLNIDIPYDTSHFCKNFLLTQYNLFARIDVLILNIFVPCCILWISVNKRLVSQHI